MRCAQPLLVVAAFLDACNGAADQVRVRFEQDQGHCVLSGDMAPGDRGPRCLLLKATLPDGAEVAFQAYGITDGPTPDNTWGAQEICTTQASFDAVLQRGRIGELPMYDIYRLERVPCDG